MWCYGGDGYGETYLFRVKGSSEWCLLVWVWRVSRRVGAGPPGTMLYDLSVLVSILWVVVGVVWTNLYHVRRPTYGWDYG